jgi:hypothetical protein
MKTSTAEQVHRVCVIHCKLSHPETKMRHLHCNFSVEEEDASVDSICVTRCNFSAEGKGQFVHCGLAKTEFTTTLQPLPLKVYNQETCLT